MNDIASILSTISIILTIATLLGGVVVFRGTANKTASEAQERAITAMREEIDSLRNKQAEIRAECDRQRNIVETIITALKMKGYTIIISGDVVSISEIGGGGTTVTTRIQEHP